MIIPAINLDFFRREDDAIVKLVRYSPKQPLCCKNVSFSHLSLLNCENSTRAIDKIM